jgi:hypothetical protein
MFHSVFATGMGNTRKPKRKASPMKLDLPTKRKASPTKVNLPLKKSTTMSVNEEERMDLTLSPSKVSIFKIDIISCNGKLLNKIELGASDLENIWTNSLLCNLQEISGYTSSKTRNFSEIRVKYQLKKPMSLRNISFEAEFTHERSGAQGIKILRCRVVGLSEVRKVEVENV